VNAGERDVVKEGGGEEGERERERARKNRNALSGHNGGEEKNVLVVSVFLPIAVNFALRSHSQRRI
jgi:hypothetical protein